MRTILLYLLMQITILFNIQNKHGSITFLEPNTNTAVIPVPERVYDLSIYTRRDNKTRRIDGRTFLWYSRGDVLFVRAKNGLTDEFYTVESDDRPFTKLYQELHPNVKLGN